MEHNTTFPIKQTELDVLRDEASSYLKATERHSQSTQERAWRHSVH